MLIIILQIATRLFCSSSIGLVTLILNGRNSRWLHRDKGTLYCIKLLLDSLYFLVVMEATVLLNTIFCFLMFIVGFQVMRFLQEMPALKIKLLPSSGSKRT